MQGYDFVLDLLSQDSFLVVNKKAAQLLGLDVAVMLSELATEDRYWKNTNPDYDGWFFSTIENVEESIPLSAYQQRKAIDVLVSNGIIETKNMGTPQKRYFHILTENLYNFLSSETSKNLTSKSEKTSQLEVKKLNTNNNNIKTIQKYPPTPQPEKPKNLAKSCKSEKRRTLKPKFEKMYPKLADVRDKAYDVLIRNGIPVASLKELNGIILSLAALYPVEDAPDCISSYLDYIDSEDYSYQYEKNKYCPHITCAKDLVDKYGKIREMAFNDKKKVDPSKMRFD